MVEATPIQAQLAEAQRDRLRVLVVGAGVAGLTVALPKTGLRNTVARFVPLRTALRPIVGLLRQQPHPTPGHLSTA